MENLLSYKNNCTCAEVSNASTTFQWRNNGNPSHGHETCSLRYRVTFPDGDDWMLSYPELLQFATDALQAGVEVRLGRNVPRLFDAIPWTAPTASPCPRNADGACVTPGYFELAEVR